MRKKVYVFDEDAGTRAILWKAFDQRGYKVSTHSRPGACPDTFQTQLDCISGRACGDFVVTSVDLPEAPRLESIKELIIKRACKVENIALMSSTWTDSELETAKMLGCKALWKPLTVGAVAAWIDVCEKRQLGRGNECFKLQKSVRVASSTCKILMYIAIFIA